MEGQSMSTILSPFPKEFEGKPLLIFDKGGFAYINPLFPASQPIPSNSNQFQTSPCNIKIPETIEVVEAVSEYISSYRKSDKLIGTIWLTFPTNEEHHFTDFSTRLLRSTEPEDLKIIRRLIEKALELSIKEVVG
ncbi:MAG: hypothetical protein WBZ36_00240 [Candidatus Nitrosopolaris sp.]